MAFNGVLLNQAHFERCPLPISDYVTDTRSVLDQAVRVINAMLDVAGGFGLLHTTLGLLRLHQMVIQVHSQSGESSPDENRNRNTSAHGIPVIFWEGCCRKYCDFSRAIGLPIVSFYLIYTLCTRRLLAGRVARLRPSPTAAWDRTTPSRTFTLKRRVDPA